MAIETADKGSGPSRQLPQYANSTNNRYLVLGAVIIAFTVLLNLALGIRSLVSDYATQTYVDNKITLLDNRITSNRTLIQSERESDRKLLEVQLKTINDNIVTLTHKIDTISPPSRRQ